MIKSCNGNVLLCSMEVIRQTFPALGFQGRSDDEGILISITVTCCENLSESPGQMIQTGARSTRFYGSSSFSANENISLSSIQHKTCNSIFENYSKIITEGGTI